MWKSDLDYVANIYYIQSLANLALVQTATIVFLHGRHLSAWRKVKRRLVQASYRELSSYKTESFNVVFFLKIISSLLLSVSVCVLFCLAIYSFQQKITTMILAVTAAPKHLKELGGTGIAICPISMVYIWVDHNPPLPMESTGTPSEDICIH